jgi:ABC-type uncharacterized transport system permease subunit
MSTTTAPEEDLVVTHAVVETQVSTRRRIIRGSLVVLTGLIIFFAWGLGAKNGDSAFNISTPFDKYQVPTIRFPGGAAAMIMGAVVVLLGLAELVRGFSKRRWSWTVGVTVVLFVLAFLCWMATGDANNPLSMTTLVQQTVVSAVPFILGALAGIICERSGVINVAIEGQMLLGAFAGAMFSSVAHNLGVGLIAAMLGGALIAVLLAVFAIRYLVNQVVLGVVLNLFALGLTNLGYQSLMQTDTNTYNAGNTLPAIKIPFLGDIPTLGPSIFDVNIIFYATFVLVVLVDIALFRTRWGLRTRAVGEHPRAADTVGIKVRGTRYRNVLIGGLIAGLAGAALTIGGSGAFNSNISSGKGFIALAAVIFGRWSPRGAVAAALLFGFTDELQVLVTSVSPPVAIPSAFLSMAPYVVTVIAVAGFIGRVQAPAADGQPYTKG